MSLFIGKDINNKSIVHTTSSISGVEQMKSEILSTTTFHSSIPYLNVIAKFDTTVYRSVVQLPYSVDGGAAYNGKFTMEVPTAAMQYFTEDYLVFIIVSSRNSGYIKTNTFKPATGIASTISAQPSYTSSGYAAFTDKKQFNNDGNGYEENISAYPNSTYKYIELAWGKGSFYGSEILQGSGRLANIDEIDSSGSLYVINIKDSNYSPLINNPTSIKIGNNQFLIEGNTTFNMANAKFLERNKIMDQYSFKLDNMVVNPINLSPNPIVAVTIKSDSSGSEISKLDNLGNRLVIANNSSNFIRYAYTNTYSINVTRNLTGTSTIQLGNIPNVAFILVTFNGTYTNGWKNLSFLPPFIKMVNGESNNLLGSHTVSTTNNQGGYTDCELTLEVQYTNNTVSLLYTTKFRHSYYTTGFNLNGNCTIMCFK